MMKWGLFFSVFLLLEAEARDLKTYETDDSDSHEGSMGHIFPLDHGGGSKKSEEADLNNDLEVNEAVQGLEVPEEGKADVVVNETPSPPGGGVRFLDPKYLQSVPQVPDPSFKNSSQDGLWSWVKGLFSSLF